MPNNKRWISLFILILIAAVILFVSLYFIYYQKDVNEIIYGLIKNYGYASIFLISVLFNMIPQPISSDVPMSVGIVSGLNPIMIIVLAIIGSTLGTIGSYYVGVILGKRNVTKLCSAKKYADACRLFDKYGKWSLFITVMTPVPDEILCWLAGIFRMRMVDFAVFGLFPKALRHLAVGLIVANIF